MPENFQTSLSEYKTKYTEVLTKNIKEHPSVTACKELREVFTKDDISVMSPEILKC